MYWTQRRPGDPSPSASIERMEQERYLEGVEPACIVPMDDARDREILSAVARGDPAPVRVAALEGFDFNRLLDGRSPLVTTAAMKGSAETVAALAAGGAQPDAVGEDGRTALDHMLSDYLGPPNRRPPVVRALLEAGADSNRPDIWGYPPLARIASRTPADAETFELVLKHGAHIGQPVSCRDCMDRGKTVLHLVKEPTLARIAIERGADPNARTESGYTPLMSVPSPEIAKLLLDHGADPNVANGGGWTALMYALQNYEAFASGEFRQRRREIAELLVAAGARLDTRNQHGADAFRYARDEAFKERLRALAAKR
jgi:ankyrin repeat protein